MPTPSETVSAPTYSPGLFGQHTTTVVPVDQTTVIQNTDRGLHNPQNPYPTDPIGGTIELTNQAGRQVKQTFGKVALFVGEQAILHVFNPQGANIVNPFVITNAIPAEGLLGTAIDGRNVIQQQFAEPKGTSVPERIGSAAAGGILGQEEGSAFFNITRIRTVSDAIDYGVNAIAGALGIKENSDDLVPLSPKAASLEKRLTQNPLSPTDQGQQLGFALFGQKAAGVQSEKDVYDITYARKEISGVQKTFLSAGFKPIQDGDSTPNDLSADSMLRDNMERAFESNAPHDLRDRSYTFGDGVDISVDALANAAQESEPPVQGSGMVFPFYFESMNTFPGTNIEKFISFQATFNGLKETYTPQWDSKIYFGRSTANYTYNSTTRNIGFSFIIWAPNRIALGLVKQRVNWLARHCYPSYGELGNNSSIRIISEAPIIKFTIGDIFRGTPGIITSLSYDWNDRWELTKDLIMPQAVKVDISITVIHDKFMQNDVAGRVDKNNKNISSDFYEFVKPPARGIGNLKDIANIINGNLGDLNGALTELDANSQIGDILSTPSNQATSFIGNSLG